MGSGKGWAKMVQEIGITDGSFEAYEKGLWLLGLEEWEDNPID